MHFVRFLFILFSAFPAWASIVSGKVISVSDGDTITIIDDNSASYKIRLMGIDAPEKKQAYGYLAKVNLSDIVYMKHVSVEWSKYDRFGRIIGKVFLNNVDVNLIQIDSGMAWHYKKYESDQSLKDRTAYATSERIARQKRIGLWQDKNPIAPWDFRRSK